MCNRVKVAQEHVGEVVVARHPDQLVQLHDCAVLWQGLLRNPAEEDIRASILRHADKEGDQFSTFTKAYAKTQPERIFAEEEKDDEGSDKEA